MSDGNRDADDSGMACCGGLRSHAPSCPTRSTKLQAKFYALATRAERNGVTQLVGGDDLSTLLAELDAHYAKVGEVFRAGLTQGHSIWSDEMPAVNALVNAYPALRAGIEQAIKTQQHMDETLRPLVEELRKDAHQARARETEACLEAARLRTERDEQAAIASNAVTKGAAYALENERLRALVAQQRGALQEMMVVYAGIGHGAGWEIAPANRALLIRAAEVARAVLAQEVP